MKNNRGFIFIALGIILLVLGLVFNFTNVFSKKDSKDPNPTPTTTPVPLKFDYVKTHDIEKKTKVSFPILNNLEVNKLYVGEFTKEYYDNKNAIFYRIDVIESNKTAEEYSDFDQETVNIMFNKDNGYKISKENIECQYLCKKYEITKDDEIIQIQFYAYIKTTDNDIAVISYKDPTNNKVNDTINTIIKNIDVTYDATYTIGETNNGNLDLKFTTDNNKNITLSLDGNVYEEVPDGFNTKKETRVKKINTDEEIVLKTHIKTDDITIDEFADKYFNVQNPGSNKKDISSSDKKIYEYDLNNIKGYAFIIDDDTVLLVMSSSDININDFVNIK